MEDTVKKRALPERVRMACPEAGVPGQRDLRGTYALLMACRHAWRRTARGLRRASPGMRIPCPDAER